LCAHRALKVTLLTFSLPFLFLFVEKTSSSQRDVNKNITEQIRLTAIIA
jgi:hypothetical protein